jgi:hypothetical protein
VNYSNEGLADNEKMPLLCHASKSSKMEWLELITFGPSIICQGLLKQTKQD